MVSETEILVKYSLLFVVFSLESARVWAGLRASHQREQVNAVVDDLRAFYMAHIVSLNLSHMTQKGRFCRLQDFSLALLSWSGINEEH